jgi:hypothetical protein
MCCVPSPCRSGMPYSVVGPCASSRQPSAAGKYRSSSVGPKCDGGRSPDATSRCNGTGIEGRGGPLEHQIVECIAGQVGFADVRRTTLAQHRFEVADDGWSVRWVDDVQHAAHVYVHFSHLVVQPFAQSRLSHIRYPELQSPRPGRRSRT